MAPELNEGVCYLLGLIRYYARETLNEGSNLDFTRRNLPRLPSPSNEFTLYRAMPETTTPHHGPCHGDRS